MIQEGDKAPDFQLPCILPKGDMGDVFVLSEHLKKLDADKKLILYFYPKDMTSGCTQQACDFRDTLLTQHHLSVIGISRDNLKTHQKFQEKYQINFPLLSDETGNICQKFGVWVEKSMYGRRYFGIDRSTFIIDSNGIIVKLWRKVKVTNHINNVLAFL